MADQTHNHDELPPGQVPLPMVLTGSMGLVLAAGLYAFGLLDSFDRALAGLVFADARELTRAVSNPVLWIATAVISYGIALVVLETPGTWRRTIIWISAMAVITAWLPVAAIAHQHVPVAAPLVAAAWAGLCTIIYTARHRMEADDPDPAEAADESTPPDATD